MAAPAIAPIAADVAHMTDPRAAAGIVGLGLREGIVDRTGTVLNTCRKTDRTTGLRRAAEAVKPPECSLAISGIFRLTAVAFSPFCTAPTPGRPEKTALTFP